MEAYGYIAALFIGITLGLIGGGGSILTIPVLVYLFLISPLLATSYSLFIVGTTSLVGAINSYTKRNVDIRIALLFGFSSVLTVFITRKFIIPLIPEIIRVGSWTLPFTTVMMLLFATLMIFASFSMIAPRIKDPATQAKSTRPLLLAVFGIGIGLITGFLGAGGGFLLIPVLVMVLKLPMKKAVGTSLLIIAMNSLVGFMGDIGQFKIDWSLLIPVTLIAIEGVFIGGILARKIQGAKLKSTFGWFVLFMGIYIIIKETIGL